MLWFCNQFLLLGIVCKQGEKIFAVLCFREPTILGGLDVFGLELSVNKVKSFLRGFVFINRQFFSLRKGLVGNNSEKIFAVLCFRFVKSLSLLR